jgi:AraC-like DNA-binding protein
MLEAAPAPALRGRVSAYYGFSSEAAGPVHRQEGPGIHVLLLISFGEEWLVDGERRESFVAGLYRRQVTTVQCGRAFGMQVNLVPQAAYSLLREPLHRLAGQTAPLEDVFDGGLAQRLHDRPSWPERFALLDEELSKRFGAAVPASTGVAWAWQQLVHTGGRARVGDLAEELGWSKKRIAARFREQIGLTPKAAARLIRFERARATAERAERPDWARIAVDCGYYDQSHLINDFRAVTGRSPETFFQDVSGTRGLASAA